MANEFKLEFKAADINKKLSMVPTPDKKKPDIKEKFADNDWDTIAWVAKNDDPSKYWKVGDYKMLDYPEVIRPGKVSNGGELRPVFFLKGNRPTGYSLGDMCVNNPKKLARVIYSKFGNKYTGSEYYYRIFNEYSGTNAEIDPVNTTTTLSYLAVTNQPNTSAILERVTESMKFEDLLELLGISFSGNSNWTDYGTVYNINKHGIHTSIGWTYDGGKVYPAKEYPVMILGFNHDNVTEVYKYGKQKAGMTLCLGISRDANGLSKPDIPPYDWTWTDEDGNMVLNLYESGVAHFDSAIDDDTLMGPYHKGDGANWGTCEFRDTLQHLLDGTILEDKIVAVDKITGEEKFRESFNYFGSEISSDKISLLSEYETHGMVKCSCGPEGDWYEFFKRGNSRFFWDSRMVDKKAFQLILWSRSPRSDKDTAPLKTPGACALICSDVMAIEGKPNGVSNPKTLLDYIKNNFSNIANKYGNYTVDMSCSAAGLDEYFTADLYKDGIFLKTLCSGTDSSETMECLQPLGISPSNLYEDINFTIGHGTQVGYTPSAWSNSGQGTLLPIFCL